MKRGSTLFLKIVLVLIGIAVLASLLVFPNLEGRNANANFFQIYFQDPFLAYVYFGSTPFFVALYQAFKLLEYIEHGKAFSQVAVNKLRNIKYCAIIIVFLLIICISWIRLAAGEDDPAGAMAIGIFATFASCVIATAAAVFQSLLQSAVDLKSENDLTV